MTKDQPTASTPDEPKAAAKGEDVNKAKTDAAEDYQKAHEYTGPALTAEEYDAAGKGEGYEPHTAEPGEDTLPQSSVKVPEGSMPTSKG